MRVLFLQRQPCVRALKYAVALRRARPTLRLHFAYQGETLTERYGTGDEAFERWWRLGADATTTELARIVAEFRPDIIHAHNLPDSLTVLALEATNGMPVIHDVHDLQSLRETPYEDGFPEPDDPLTLEKLAVEGSAALVTVSEELLGEISIRHRLPPLTTVFPNYALERDFPARLAPAERPRNGPVRLVYQGTLSAGGGHYDLREVFASLASDGISIDIYPGRPAPDYHPLAEAFPNIRFHQTLPAPRLFEVLPRYDLGWAGFNATLNRAHLDTVLPNKVFEYLGCGLPVVTLGHKALVRFITENGVGLSVESTEDLPAELASADLPELRRRVAAARSGLSVEANIDRIADLYEGVAG